MASCVYIYVYKYIYISGIYLYIFIYLYSSTEGGIISDSYVQYILALVVPSLRLYVPILLIIII